LLYKQVSQRPIIKCSQLYSDIHQTWKKMQTNLMFVSSNFVIDQQIWYFWCSE